MSSAVIVWCGFTGSNQRQANTSTVKILSVLVTRFLFVLLVSQRHVLKYHKTQHMTPISSKHLLCSTRKSMLQNC